MLLQFAKLKKFLKNCKPFLNSRVLFNEQGKKEGSEDKMNKQPKFKIDNAKLTRLVAKAQGGNQKALDEVVNMVSGYIYYYLPYPVGR